MSTPSAHASLPLRVIRAQHHSGEGLLASGPRACETAQAAFSWKQGKMESRAPHAGWLAPRRQPDHGQTGRSSDFRDSDYHELRFVAPTGCVFSAGRAANDSCSVRSRSQRRDRSGVSPDSLFFQPQPATGHRRPRGIMRIVAGVVNPFVRLVNNSRPHRVPSPTRARFRPGNLDKTRRVAVIQRRAAVDGPRRPGYQSTVHQRSRRTSWWPRPRAVRRRPCPRN